MNVSDISIKLIISDMWWAKWCCWSA